MLHLPNRLIHQRGGGGASRHRTIIEFITCFHESWIYEFFHKILVLYFRGLQSIFFFVIIDSHMGIFSIENLWMPNFCHNDELSSTMSWVGYTDSELFTLCAGNSQILLKISVIPILLSFMNLVAQKFWQNLLNSSSNSTHYCGRNYLGTLTCRTRK